ncbi:hypothetical protein PAHAL_9G097000 [Panicum hallii]|uniref:ATP synthase delta chain, chloroplastic n=1 Tax=Panicum hallii TaxID=206008 RepID=A0A2T8I0U2_9POAL|nr:uncharacterized protein LOC112873986 [Panicum hallii]PVH31259.1 hypothetical protein PAHAL_9G097000 [Panicum hallii]
MTRDHTGGPGIGGRRTQISPDGACAAAGAASCARQILPSSSPPRRQQLPGYAAAATLSPPLASSWQLLLTPPAAPGAPLLPLAASPPRFHSLAAPSDHRLPRAELLLRRAMNILNQPINPGGHPVFPAAKEGGHLTPALVRFDGVPAQPSTAAAGRSNAHYPRWQAQTLRRASSYVGVEHDGATAAAVPAAGPAPALFKPPTLDFLRSLLDRNCSLSSALAGGEASAPPPSPPQVLALRVVVTSAVELDARQTELIARKMRRLTGFVNLTVENVVDPSLIAGFVICYGTDDSHVIDLSVKGQLAALKNRVDSIDQTTHAHGHPHH